MIVECLFTNCSCKLARGIDIPICNLKRIRIDENRYCVFDNQKTKFLTTVVYCSNNCKYSIRGVCSRPKILIDRTRKCRDIKEC